MSAGGSSVRSGPPARFLVCRCGAQACALPIEHVVETSRPLPIRDLAGTPEYVLGVSMLRGEPVPVVDGGRLMGSGGSPVGRFVSLRVESRRVALDTT